MQVHQLITEKHYSYGCKLATFMYAVGNPTRKLILVEAANEHAVQLLEYLLGIEGRVSSTCQILTVHRGCVTGVRSKLVEEVDYVDFVLDMVDQEKFKDKRVILVFFASLNEAQTKYASAKISLMNQVPQFEAHQAVPQLAEHAEVDDNSAQKAKLAGALTGLGFHKPSVNKFVSKVQSQIGQVKMEQLIIQGIREMSAGGA